HDGEKDTRGPADFSGNASSKLNDDEEDDEDVDDEDDGHRGGKRSRGGKLKGDLGSLGYGSHHSHLHSGPGGGISMPQAPSLMHSSPVSNMRGNNAGLDLIGGHGGSGAPMDRLGMSMMSNKRPNHHHGGHSGHRLGGSGNPHSRSPSGDVPTSGYGYPSSSPFGSGGRGGGGYGSSANSHGGGGSYPPLFGPGPGSATSPSSGFMPLHGGSSGRGGMSGGAGGPFSSAGGYGGSGGGGGHHGNHGRDLFTAFLDADEQSRQGHGGGGPPHSASAGGGGGSFGFDWPSHGPSGGGGSSGSGVSNPSASSSTTDGNSSGGPHWLDFLSGAANSSSNSGGGPPSSAPGGGGGPSLGGGGSSLGGSGPLGGGLSGLGPVPPATTSGGSPGAGVSWERGGEISV
ncbi:hypothetical protein CVT24_002059, partial [Panaeolus cyanescens]